MSDRPTKRFKRDPADDSEMIRFLVTQHLSQRNEELERRYRLLLEDNRSLQRQLEHASNLCADRYDQLIEIGTQVVSLEAERDDLVAIATDAISFIHNDMLREQFQARLALAARPYEIIDLTSDNEEE